MMDVRAALRALQLELPPAPKAAAVYVPVQQTGNLLFISGQLPMRDGQLTATGAVPSPVSVEAAQLAAEQCSLNALALVDSHLNGDWSKLVKFVRLGVFVLSANDFAQQHIVANGASTLLEKVFGEQGRHARAAIGVNALPLNASVEVEMIVEVR